MKIATNRIAVVVSALAMSAGSAAEAAMKPATSGATLTLAQSLVYDGGGNLQINIAAGPYKAWKEHASGIYYLGPPTCFSTIPTKKSWGMNFVVGQVWSAADCGIFVSSKGKPPKIFTVLGTGTFGHQAQLDPATAQAITSNQPALQGAPIASGVGAGLAGGLIAGLDALSKGKPSFPYGKAQPPGTMLQDALGAQIAAPKKAK